MITGEPGKRDGISSFRKDVEDAVIAGGQVAGFVRNYMSTSLLTCRDVATRLGVAPATVYAWRRAGRLTGVRVVERWAFEHGEVARFKSEQESRTKSAR